MIDAAHRLAYRHGYRLVRIWWRLFGGRAVGSTVVLRCGDELLVLRESYRPGLGLPAGGREPGETAVETAVRELYEEVGISLSADRLVMVRQTRLHVGGRVIDNTLFEARVEEKVEPRVDSREIVWAGWMRIEEVLAGDPQPGLRDYLHRLRRQAP